MQLYVHALLFLRMYQRFIKAYLVSICVISQIGYYKAFHRFGQAKIAYGGLVLGSSQFSLLSRLPQIMMLASKGVKIDLKIIIWLC